MSKTKGQANEIDKLVGANLKRRRVLACLSQEGMAGMIGVSFQQVQKYENGKNRISAGRLYQLSEILGVPVGYFFGEEDKAIPKDMTPQQGKVVHLLNGKSPKVVSAIISILEQVKDAE